MDEVADGEAAAVRRRIYRDGKCGGSRQTGRLAPGAAGTAVNKRHGGSATPKIV